MARSAENQETENNEHNAEDGEHTTEPLTYEDLFEQAPNNRRSRPAMDQGAWTPSSLIGSRHG